MSPYTQTTLFLAGDVGGTKTLLALASAQDQRIILSQPQQFDSQSYPSLSAIVNEYLRDKQIKLSAACFGVPGPVRNQSCHTTNLPWHLEGAEIAQSCAIPHVMLLNDLQVNGYGISLLQPDDLLCLNPGQVDLEGHSALISPGTGLGEAGLLRRQAEFYPIPSEGGHCDFAPRNPLEAELWRFLYEKFGHVSYERLLCGSGLLNIFNFLKKQNPALSCKEIEERMRHEDPAAVISSAALAQTHPLCMQALDLFIAILGAEAGNLALKFYASRGLYIGGGIAPRLVEKLQETTFLAAFTDKGRHQPLLEAIPVYLILNSRTALLGAAKYAATGQKGF